MVAIAAATASLALTRQIAGAARVVAWLPSAAPAIGGIANLLEDAFGMSALGFAFGIGNILTLVGLVVLGVSTLLDGRNDRVVGALLSSLGVAFALPAFGRTAGVPILCFVMAYVLAGRADPSGEPESPQSRER